MTTSMTRQGQNSPMSAQLMAGPNGKKNPFQDSLRSAISLGVGGSGGQPQPAQQGGQGNPFQDSLRSAISLGVGGSGGQPQPAQGQLAQGQSAQVITPQNNSTKQILVDPSVPQIAGGPTAPRTAPLTNLDRRMDELLAEQAKTMEIGDDREAKLVSMQRSGRAISGDAVRNRQNAEVLSNQMIQEAFKPQEAQQITQQGMQEFLNGSQLQGLAQQQQEVAGMEALMRQRAMDQAARAGGAAASRAALQGGAGAAGAALAGRQAQESMALQGMQDANMMGMQERMQGGRLAGELLSRDQAMAGDLASQNTMLRQNMADALVARRMGALQSASGQQANMASQGLAAEQALGNQLVGLYGGQIAASSMPTFAEQATLAGIGAAGNVAAAGAGGGV